MIRPLTPSVSRGQVRIDARFVSTVAAVALHVAAATALLQLDAVRRPLLEAVPLMVHLVTPPAVETPRPPPEVVRPKPRLVERQPVPQAPVEPAPLVVAASAPSPAAVAPQPEPAPVVAVVPPPPVVPPSFDAAYLRNPPPAYPLMSRRRAEQGKVMLRVHVSADGTASQAEVQASSGHQRLDEAAVQAVLQWRFVPAKQGDRPVAAWVLVPIVFALQD
jgi:protein TonB